MLHVIVSVIAGQGVSFLADELWGISDLAFGAWAVAATVVFIILLLIWKEW